MNICMSIMFIEPQKLPHTIKIVHWYTLSVTVIIVGKKNR